ncbi:hypothetical protein YC2023_016015 [Brassica napus]
MEPLQQLGSSISGVSSGVFWRSGEALGSWRRRKSALRVSEEPYLVFFFRSTVIPASLRRMKCRDVFSSLDLRSLRGGETTGEDLVGLWTGVMSPGSRGNHISRSAPRELSTGGTRLLTVRGGAATSQHRRRSVCVLMRPDLCVPFMAEDRTLNNWGMRLSRECAFGEDAFGHKHHDYLLYLYPNFGEMNIVDE